MEEYSIGIDVGGTKIAYGLFDGSRNLVKKYRTQSDASLSSEAFFDNIAQMIQKMMEDNALTKDALRGIGIGMPSYILYEEGRIIKTTNLPKIHDFPAKEYLFTKLGGDVRILFDNDSHTGALAEHRYGAGRGFKHMLYCPVSTGISSGIIINNELFRGRYGWAGESGHMIVTPGEGIECGCGNKGCLMSYCSGSMIVKHIQQRIKAGVKTIMVELAGSADKITPYTIQIAFDQGDDLAKWALEQMAQYMAVWTYNLYVTLNINCFVFGGGLLKFGDRLFPRIRKLFDAYNKNKMTVYFKKAELGDDFGIIGAAELLFQ
ncbi:ROK family protein [Caproiciproducens sp. CPB-2]|uniref:ROK family protein n=1 Tax=Caproiciproducens sp. CPB-2 TaxID=3030017 RepID=UPI0023DC923C|nr:ROK family protein [Caproiciproducens sp. CPB-2]MDF1494819.1 ROK family protein [Caproiciproducens sp. CPB-2]